MNLCWHVRGRPFLHLIWKRDHYYVTVTVFGRRKNWTNLPSYPYPD